MASFTSSSLQALSALDQAFEAYLEATDLYPGLKTVNCTAQGGRLVVLACHRAPEVDAPRTLLRDLEGAFMELMPAVGLPDAAWSEVDAVPVRICLQLRSAQQPYATHTFTWRVEDAAQAVFPPEPSPPQKNGHGKFEQDDGATSSNPGEAKLTAVSITAPSPDPDPDSKTEPIVSGESTDALAEIATLSPSHGHTHGLPEAQASGSVPFSDRAIALPDATIDPPEDLAWLKGSWHWSQARLKTLAQFWIYGLAGMIVLGSGLFAYAVTRPCVVGGCDRLEDAQTFYDDAQLQLTGRPDEEALITARDDLQAAIELLTPIPHWAPYYETAQANLQQYQTDATALNALIRSKDIALEAATLSQNPPHSVEHWVDIQLLWQQSINQLETISADSPAWEYSQNKLEEYRANHKAIGRRIVAEEEAEANFNTAIQTGQLARQRMETAESLPGWQLAAKEWQAAIKGLSVIPQGTSAYSEAQTYLQDYRQQLARTSAQASLEENSTRFYQQAVQAAREAKAYEAKNQWTLAVTQWKQAVNSAQQISPESTLGSESAALLESYQPALTNAQSRLQTAVALQKLTQTVGSICADSATPCQVAEDPSQIQVTLSSQYAEPLRQAITPPAADGTFAFTNELTPSVQQLIEEIMTISHQVDRQVAIYDSHGGFVARYRPDLGGFIKN
jgi:hypothetical protein